MAYIAHDVDAEQTDDRLRRARDLDADVEVGPADGIPWREVAHIGRRVIWANGETAGGQVVYIPQNLLFRFHEDPTEVSRQLERTLEKTAPDLTAQRDASTAAIKRANAETRAALDAWWHAHDRLASAESAKRDYGTSKALSVSLAEARAELAIQRRANQLSDDESTLAETTHARIATLVETATTSRSHATRLDALLSPSPPPDGEPPLHVEISVSPSIDTLPTSIAAELQGQVDTAVADLELKIDTTMREAVGAANEAAEAADEERAALQSTHKDLLARSVGTTALEQVQKRAEGLERQLAEAQSLEKETEEAADQRTSAGEAVSDALAKRAVAVDSAQAAFNSSGHRVSRFALAMECEVPPVVLENLAGAFNKTAKNDFLDDARSKVDIEQVRSECVAFLDQLASGKVKLRQGASAREVSREVLLTVEEIRVSAELEGDKIGGFRDLSMTPGKRALFALLLLLGEDERPWPLLIDQPEDDLDSRSIYTDIVTELVARKSERQILMVTHDANLVVGADAENVVVANRHGSDAMNKKSRKFDYLVGPIENSRPWNESRKFALERGGVREHAIWVLDGGEDAFRRRQVKYAIEDPK